MEQINKTIIREGYVLQHRQMLVFGSDGEKIPSGKPYILLQTTRGNVAIKDSVNFIEALKRLKKGSRKYIWPEFMLEVKNRLEFDARGNKRPTGKPYIWIQGISSKGLIEYMDLDQFIKDFVEMMK